MPTDGQIYYDWTTLSVGNGCSHSFLICPVAMRLQCCTLLQAYFHTRQCHGGPFTESLPLIPGNANIDFGCCYWWCWSWWLWCCCCFVLLFFRSKLNKQVLNLTRRPVIAFWHVVYIYYSADCRTFSHRVMLLEFYVFFTPVLSGMHNCWVACAFGVGALSNNNSSNRHLLTRNWYNNLKYK